MAKQARRYTGKPQAAKPVREHKSNRAPGEAARGQAHERGYDWVWRRARVQYLNANPLCVKCREVNRTVEATVVDHAIPHRGSARLFWDETNWQSLCERCHNIKTAKGL